MSRKIRTTPDLMADYFETIKRIEDRESFGFVFEVSAACDEAIGLIWMVLYQGGESRVILRTFLDDLNAIRSAKDDVCDELIRRVWS